MIENKLELQDATSKRGFPKSIFFIVGNEFCERFSYYGMRTVLYLYLIDQLNFPSGTATVVYHAFTMLCYFTPILGAMLADSLLGKFKTILYVSILYALGNIVLSMAATPPLNFPMRAISMVGLVMIALGTGGIKPCVSAFGGDQFEADQVKARERFFFIFYFAINAGSLISTYVTPELRGSVQCFGGQTCFPLAFGVPAAIMIVAIILFVCGKPLYRIIPPQGNLMGKVLSCIGSAIKNKVKGHVTKRDHWLDYADQKFDKKFIGEVRATLKVMYLFIPLPFFWALFDQQGSTWTLQATRLTGRITSSFGIQPDQMQVVNPLLILIFIPIFDSGIYPLLARCKILTKPLKRMFAGGLLAVIAFVVAAILQLQIEKTLPSNPTEGHVAIGFINTSPCSVQITSLAPNGSINVTVPSANTLNSDVFLDKLSTIELQLRPLCQSVDDKTVLLNVSSGTAYNLFLNNVDNRITTLLAQVERTKPKKGASIRLFFNTDSVSSGDEIQLKDSKNSYFFPLNSPLVISDYESVLPSSNYEVWLRNNGSQEQSSLLGNVNVELGGAYTLAILMTGLSKNVSVFIPYTEVLPNSIHILWQVPQYIIITAGEIMFSITGLEFSYSQAPVSMKSVLTAAWLLTTAFGNLIVIIIEEIPFGSNQSSMFFIYAGAMLVVMLVFALMCRSYQYITVDSDGISSNSREDKIKDTSSDNAMAEKENL